MAPQKEVSLQNAGSTLALFSLCGACQLLQKLQVNAQIFSDDVQLQGRDANEGKHVHTCTYIT